MGSTGDDYRDTNYPTIRAAVRQRALGEFLRRHRELVVEQAGTKQADERKRRTSGLRREEVAQMAGISSAWYTRLEQGKEVTPSSAALGRIAEALRLVPAERAYLFLLAGRIDPNDALSFTDKPASKTIESCVLSISYPAVVFDKYWTPLFWNVEFENLFSSWLKGSEANLLRYVFLDLNAKTFVVDWEAQARRLLAEFRADFGKHIDDPKMLELVRGLSEESELFRRVWKDQRVLFREGIKKSFNHPQSGLRSYCFTTFFAAADPALKLVILKPCN
ncbi:MAG: helix-turn-helix transcriptional regulator [Xanthobacteraceae bacterium]